MNRESAAECRLGRLALGAGAVILAVSLLLLSFGPRASEPLGVRKEYGALPLSREAVLSEVGKPQAPSESTLVWKQSALTATPDVAQATYIVEAGHGELLAPFITTECRPDLDAELESVEETMKATAEVYNEVVKDVKKSLVSRPDRIVRCRTGSQGTDPESLRLKETIDEVEGKTGAVWADLDPEGTGQIHYVVLWNEWPQLYQLLADLGAMAEVRKLTIRAWVASRWNKDGSKFLALK